MKLNTNISLSFNGQSEAAFSYERSLDGTISYMLKWGDSPMAAEAPDGWGAKVYHATLKIGDTVINGGGHASAPARETEGFFADTRDGRPSRCRPDISGACRKRHDRDAAPGNILGQAVWRSRRRVRNPMVHQLRVKADRLN